MSVEPLGPVFIIGPPRCGTTLMHDLLALHPQASAHSEDFHHFHHNLMLFRDRQEREEHFRLTTADASPELAREYQQAIAQALGRSRRLFVLKISTLSIQVDYVRALVPTARFIQLVRDGRDAACSMEDLRQALEREQGHPRQLGPAPDPFGLWCAETFENVHLRAAATWCYHATRSMLDLRFAGGDSFLRIRYEDLIADPQDAMARVLEFLHLKPVRKIERALAEIRDAPGAPSRLGFSTSQAAGPKRVGRYETDLPVDVRVVIAPLIDTPMRLLGYAPDPTPDPEHFAGACASLGIDQERWQKRIDEEAAWFSLHHRVFAPERMLRQPDTPSGSCKPLLVDGALLGTTQCNQDGRTTGTLSWVQKQERRHAFPDAGRQWLEIAKQMNGHQSVGTLIERYRLDAEALELLGRLHGLGFVGYA